MSRAKYQTPDFRAERKRINEAQARGEWLTCVQGECVMGSRDIAPHEPADVAHDDSGTVVLGPAHATCNRRDGGIRRHQDTKRRWRL